MNIDSIRTAVDIDDNLVCWNKQQYETLAENQQRYASWKNHAEANDLYPTEFLLPRINCHCPESEPSFMANGKSMAIVSDETLRQDIDTLGPWSFHFGLRKNIVTNDSPIGKNRLLCRSHLITSTVETLLGDALPSSTFLDMGCHSGFFSLDIASRGAKQVTGIELRQSNVDQARYLADFYQIANADFQVADVMDYSPEQQFSVVYNLGLLYHVTCPIELVRKTYDLCTDMAVIDTVCHKEPVSAYIAAFNKDTSDDAEGKYTAELHPTYRALIDTMYDAGFKELLEIVPNSGKVAGIYRIRFAAVSLALSSDDFVMTPPSQKMESLVVPGRFIQ